MNIGVLLSCLAGLLRHTALVPSPKTHFGIVQLLVAMLSPQLYGQVGGHQTFGVWLAQPRAGGTHSS